VELTDIPIVRGFPRVFLNGLSGLLPEREVEVFKNTILGTVLIAQSPYKMTPMELAELKIQLQELLDKSLSNQLTIGCPSAICEKQR
jgi:hypothetical protein